MSSDWLVVSLQIHNYLKDKAFVKKCYNLNLFLPSKMDNFSFSKNISLTFRRKAIAVFLFFSFFQTFLYPAHLIPQDSVKVETTDSTEIIRPLPKWLLDQKKNQTVKKEQSSDILESNNYFLFSALFTAIILLAIVGSVSIIIVKRRSKRF